MRISVELFHLFSTFYKQTIQIAGNTIYNAVKLGEVDIGEGDRPVYPPKIKSTEVSVIQSSVGLKK